MCAARLPAPSPGRNRRDPVCQLFHDEAVLRCSLRQLAQQLTGVEPFRNQFNQIVVRNPVTNPCESLQLMAVTSSSWHCRNISYVHAHDESGFRMHLARSSWSSVVNSCLKPVHRAPAELGRLQRKRSGEVSGRLRKDF